MFFKNNRKKSDDHKAPPEAKKAVTASLIMTVVALALCFGILIGGIDSDADIGDIFTYDTSDPPVQTEGNVPVSYGNGEITAVFDTTDPDHIKLNYYGETQQNEQEIVFTFGINGQLASISRTVKPDETEKQDKNKPEKPEPRGEESSTQPDSPGLIPISIFTYKDSKLSEQTNYENNKSTGSRKITSHTLRDQSVQTVIESFNESGVLTQSESYTTDRYKNITAYAYYDKDGTQVSGYKRAYTYDSAGNITACTLTADQTAESIECIYRYDERNNIVYSAIYKNDLATVVTTYSYTYDKKSNVISSTESTIYSASGQSTVKTTKYIYADNRMTAKTIFDQAGNILFTGSYNYSEDGNMTRSAESDNTKGENLTVNYEYMTGVLYSRMQTILNRWDVTESELKEPIFS